MLTSTSAPRFSPCSSPPAVSMLAAPVSWTTQRVALPQLSTSPPSLFQMRILRSAMALGSSAISWSQPTPGRRSAIARPSDGVTSNGSSRASIITKSLPSPCILSKRRFIWSDQLRSARAHRRDHLSGEAVHLFRLRTHLQEQKVETRRLIFGDPLLDLLGCADKIGPQASVRDGIFLQFQFALELRSRQPLVEIIEALGRSWRQLGDALQLLLRLGFAVADDSESGHAILHARFARFRAAIFHVGDFGRDRIDRVAVHHVRVAEGRDQRLGRFALAAGIDVWTRLAHGLGLTDRVFELVALAFEGEALVRPQAVDHLQPFGRAGIAVV